MLKLQLSKPTEEFRESFRSWLKTNPAPRAENATLESFINVGRVWQKTLSSGGWVGVHWPSEYGGRGLSLVEEAIIQEELVRAESPQLLGLFGLTMVGPVLISFGTPQQKSKYLAKILSGDEIWCQGFSEPGAGSDIAALKTRAEKVDGGFLLSGQKVWTSFAHIADWCFVLCRTTTEKKKHEGLSYVLVDMKSKGITTRPLRQISGDDEFNEVFFDKVFVPEENVVGSVGDGWKIAVSTLMYERVVLTFARQLQSEVALRGIIADFGEGREGALKYELGNEISRAAAVRAMAYDHLLEYGEGQRPGPEGSLDKLLWSESFQAISKLACKIKGVDVVLGETNEAVAHEVHRYLYSRGRTIAAGTSEIQRNIIAERLLELPRLKFS